MRYFSFLVLLLLVFTSCKKQLNNNNNNSTSGSNNNNSNSQTNDNCLLVKQTSPGDESDYIWDSHQHMINNSFYLGGSLMYDNAYAYDSAGRLAKFYHVQGNATPYGLVYTYSSGRVTASGENINTVYYKNSQGQIDSLFERDINYGGDSTYFWERYVYNPAGDIIESFNSSFSHFRYTYDAMKNPYYGFPFNGRYYAQDLSKHNLIKMTLYDQNGSPMQTDTFHYEYNNKGYPVKTDSYNLEYDCR